MHGPGPLRFTATLLALLALSACGKAAPTLTLLPVQRPTAVARPTVVKQHAVVDIRVPTGSIAVKISMAKRAAYQLTAVADDLAYLEVVLQIKEGSTFRSIDATEVDRAAILQRQAYIGFGALKPATYRLLVKAVDAAEKVLAEKTVEAAVEEGRATIVGTRLEVTKP